MKLPKNFAPPTLKTDSYIARKLTVKDAELDFQAVMSSINTIHEVRGSRWPTTDLTLEEDVIDLAWHQREFEFGNSFAYTVMNLDETECLGCIYFYPVGKGVLKFETLENKNAEVEISWWVTQKMYDQGFYNKLSLDIKNWVETEWPFKNVIWANKKLPKAFSTKAL